MGKRAAGDENGRTSTRRGILVLGVAVLGYGTMGRVHVEALRQIQGVRVVGIYTRRPVPGVWPAPRYDEMKPLVTRKDVHVVDICLPTHLHLEAVQLAAECGKHIFLEKPLVRRPEQVPAIRDAIKRAGVQLMVGHVLRFFPEYQQLHRIALARGAKGVAGAARRSSMPAGEDDWYGDVGKSGGVVLDLSIHDFDFCRWTLGPVREVFCRTAAGGRYALTTLVHDNGSLSHIEGSWLDAPGLTMEFELAGKGYLLQYSSAAAVPLRVWTRGDDGAAAGAFRLPLGKTPYQRELEAFFDSLRRNEAPPVTWEAALESAAVAWAALRSAESRRPVSPKEVVS
ncbi:Gfo/Idh/MocA family oxidoreductase [Kyrpidia sp.]|uniref:Gfo/Idh/MocA family protein n=1 Tax=Kyrpidia sp. TaxID=2073077 RepID=UPI0025868904|nr:Gfo/Idh/MocA family oxidoreductase [Kyrpidia sp.]MCL6576221.1 Gfo/Idh/MocA family oxidoreductase [Kyrpidia sp.]